MRLFEEDFDDSDYEDSHDKKDVESFISEENKKLCNKCDEYDYRCKKEITLRKHNNTIHPEKESTEETRRGWPL